MEAFCYDGESQVILQSLFIQILTEQYHLD